MKTKHRIINGDSRLMKELETGSVDLVVTSPPYWQLKDYGSTSPGEIGFNDSYEDYIRNLNLVWEECFRVLDTGCRLCIDIGDQYARAVYYGRYKVIPIRTEIIKFCETIGFDYMGAIIWQKVATTNTSGGATIMGSFPFPRNGILKLDYEFILVFKKKGQSDKVFSPEVKEQSRLTKEEWNMFFSGHWNFAGMKQKQHLAMFPLELPRRLIKMFSFAGETVLDPFLGSGTTSLAALELNRSSVGYEINPEFLPIIKDKLGFKDSLLFNKPDFKIIKQKLSPGEKNFEERIKKFPYIFKDPVKLEIKLDPRERHFGSKIDKNSREREKYFSVKQIVSPTVLILNDDSTVRLMGIKEDEEKRDQAVDFLKNKFKGQRVFLRFDQVRCDAENRLLVYLYLKNKTFINAHLLKEKLVFPDESIDFKYKEKFLKLRFASGGSGPF